jgi:hypothetical protein
MSRAAFVWLCLASFNACFMFWNWGRFTVPLSAFATVWSFGFFVAEVVRNER